MSKDYEKVREKVQKDFKDKLEEKDKRIFYLEKLVKELEAEKHDLEVENMTLRNKVAQNRSGLPLLVSATELVGIYTEKYRV